MARWHNKRVPASADGQDVDRAKDWLTALSPLILMMVVNYHWPAALAVLTAAAGYVAVTVLWQWLKLTACRVAPALVCGVVVACCLPDSAPLWLSALAGLVGGIVTVIPALIHRFFKKAEVSCPVYFAPLAGYLTVRFIFPSFFTAFSVPLMWMSADTVATATPLTYLGNPDTAVEVSHLFWGFDAGSMGGGPAPALLLGCIYLFLRRRLNPRGGDGWHGAVAVLDLLEYASLLPAGRRCVAVRSAVGRRGLRPRRLERSPCRRCYRRCGDRAVPPDLGRGRLGCGRSRRRCSDARFARHLPRFVPFGGLFAREICKIRK